MNWVKPQTELKLEVIPDETLDAEDKQALLKRECEVLLQAANEMGIKAELPEIPSPEGARGFDIAIGAIILTPIVAQSVNWLFEYIKSKVNSKTQPDCAYKITFTGGGESKTIEIKASNLNEEEIKKLVEAIDGLTT